ncbi:MAG TPA: acetoacetate--CoA ligase [Solirubrobacteraceae bacterium]|nr:acetoacetate--CoA ligase [Solirubrobacteraceae bacterium]
MMDEGTLLWEPPAQLRERSHMARFMAERGAEDYAALWRWSVDDLEGFWAAIWERFDVGGSYDRVLADASMPGAVWFPGARLNYAERIFRGKPDDRVAIVHASELRGQAEWTWRELREQTAGIRAGLAARGVGPGDVVAAYLPNVPETIAAFLAVASLGAVWSSAAPEFGARSVCDRFGQIEPKVLLAVDGYRYGGRDFDRRAAVDAIAEEIGAPVVRLGNLAGSGWEEGFLGDAPLAFEPVPFDHPLWVLFSSGTTGLPKAIVQGQGGILLEHLKMMYLHLDAHEGDRVFWFTTTGWMMWNFLVSVLLTDAAIVLYDGNPGTPDLGRLWDLAEQSGMTCFGTSASYIAACMKAGIEPAAGRDLSALRAVGSTGSPLAPEGFAWVYEHVGADTWLFSTSGGTDVCTAFVGGSPVLPVYLGELQARALGADLHAFDEQGNAVIEEVGELVLTQPMPSMPLRFWDDADGSRLREAYFDHYPGVWRHGDWIRITERGTAVIYGRSDSTINRGGVRMGTSEIYRAVLAVPDVVDALVVDVPREGEDSWMPLFVVLRDGVDLDDALVAEIRRRVREDCSPRHVPSEIRAIAEVPRTLSGKVLEVPVKRILMGAAPEQAASRDSLANPAALDYFVELARQRG